MTKHLFVYGTLAPGREPMPLRPQIARMTLVGTASVAGALYDLGTYPGAILDGSDRIFGSVFQVPGDDAFWQALDSYEGFDPGQPNAGLFRRETCRARLDPGQEVTCDIYVYNGTPPRGQRVADGLWRPAQSGVSERQ